MKKVVYAVSFVLVFALVFSACKGTKGPKSIVGKWQIDSVYYENQDETFHKLADYAVKNATKTKQVLEDSLKSMEKRGLNNAIDSLYYQTFQNQLASTNQMIDYYSNFEVFEGDMLKSATNAKGAVFEFKKDSTLILPNAQMPAKWYVEDNKLYIVSKNASTPMDIVSLSKNKLVLRAKQEIDSTLALVVVYQFSKVKSSDQSGTKK